MIVAVKVFLRLSKALFFAAISYSHRNTSGIWTFFKKYFLLFLILEIRVGLFEDSIIFSFLLQTP